MKDTEKVIPYTGAKEHYLLDIDNQVEQMYIGRSKQQIEENNAASPR